MAIEDLKEIHKIIRGLTDYVLPTLVLHDTGKLGFIILTVILIYSTKTNNQFSAAGLVNKTRKALFEFVGAFSCCINVSNANAFVWFGYFKNEPDIMTVPEAAKALRCGKNTIYDLIKEGKLNGVYVGNKIVVPKAALVEFILYEKNYVILKPEPKYLSWTSEKTCDMLGAAKNKSQKNKKGA